MEDATPKAEQVRSFVESVLQTQSFQIRVEELRNESKKLDFLDLVHSELLRRID